MSEQDIRNFLTAHNSYFQNPVQDVDGVTFDMATVMAQAAATHQISPKVLLTTLEKENSGVTTTTRPSDTTLRLLMGYDPPNYLNYTARSQVDHAASAFRWYHNTIQQSGQTPTGWRVGAAKQTDDGVAVTPATNAVAGQFTYTPHAGPNWGGSGGGGVNLFYQLWNSFGFVAGVANNAFDDSDLIGPPAPPDYYQPAFPDYDSEAFTPLPDVSDAVTAAPPTAPNWSENFNPISTASSKASPPTFSWPEATAETGQVVDYLVYWGDDPAGTGDKVVASNTFVPPESPLPTDMPVTRYLRVAARNEAGQVSPWQTAVVWQYDPVPPTGSLSLRGGGNQVKTLNITLELAADDEGGQVAQMRFSPDGQTWAEWEPFLPQRMWQLDETSRPQTIYAQIQDEAGNVSEPIATTITADLTLTPPTSANYALGCSTFSIGGGAKSSGSYTVHSVTGQPYETGTMQSGSYQVNSGYWPACGSAAAPPAGSPIRISPAHQTVSAANGEFCLDVTVESVTNLGGFDFDLTFPPSLLQATQTTLGAFLTSTGRTAVPLGPTIDNSAGSINFGAGTVGSQAGPDGGGVLANVCFNPQQAGAATLTFASGQLTDILGNVSTSNLNGGTITIQGSSCYWADMDCDSDVDVADVQQVAGRWGTQTGDAGYSPYYDLDSDGDIDIVDVQKVASQWNWPNLLRENRPEANTGTITLSLTPSLLQIQPGQSKTINLEVTNASNLAAFESALAYNPNELTIDSISFSNFLASSGRTVVTTGPIINNQTGVATFGAASFGAQAGVSGNGILVTIQVTAKANGNGVIDLNNSQATDPDAVLIPVTENDASYSMGYRVYLPVVVR